MNYTLPPHLYPHPTLTPTPIPLHHYLVYVYTHTHTQTHTWVRPGKQGAFTYSCKEEKHIDVFPKYEPHHIQCAFQSFFFHFLAVYHDHITHILGLQFPYQSSNGLTKGSLRSLTNHSFMILSLPEHTKMIKVHFFL